MKIFFRFVVLLFIASCSHLPFGQKEKPIIHSGHFLNAQISKERNEELLRTMEKKNYSLVNLTLDDLLIARSKGIELDKFQKLVFLNSSIVDLEKDALLSGSNIVPYYILNGVCFIGLSDSNFDPKLHSEHFLINDYVLSILKVKHETKNENPKSFVIIHKLGRKEFNLITERLPEDFRALLTN